MGKSAFHSSEFSPDMQDTPHDSQAWGNTPNIKQWGDNCLSYREKSAIQRSATNNTGLKNIQPTDLS